MIGKKLSPILVEIEETIWEKEANDPEPHMFTPEGQRAGVKIFMAILLDMMWDKQEREKKNQRQRSKEAEEAGMALRLFLKQFTGKDPHDFYKQTT